jgi:phage protein D
VSDLSAEYQIAIGGSPIDPSLDAHLLDLRVETTNALPDVCTMRFAEADVSGVDDLAIIDNPKFALGAPLTVKFSALGGTLAPVFEGEITTIEAEMGARHDGTPVLELIVTGHDRSHRMHRLTTTRTFRQVTVTDVAKKLAQEHGLKVGKIAPIGGEPAEVLHQVGETDWRFLSGLVSGHGGELDVAGGALHIIDPTKAVAPVMDLQWGENLERFRPRVSTVGQVAKVQVYGWDPKGKKELVQTATAAASTSVEKAGIDKSVSGSTVLVATAPVTSTGDVKARAGAIAARIGHERVQGEATANGDPRLVAGSFVSVKGVGKRFGGTHRIVSAVHVHGPRGYQTRLTFGAGGRPLAETVGGRANANGNGAGHGFAEHLAIGIVTSNDDPDNLGRIKVSYPTLGGQVESGWARVVREASGKERGVVALPHVNDEVVVGFQHGDVRRPFVLGALFNGKDTPGADLVKTTSSLAARFPRDLDVQTKEKVLLTAGKDITVKSEQGPLEVSAGKEIKITASAGGPPSAITIDTTGQIKMTGKQGVEISASGPLKITSTAPVTVESNAMLQLKGSIVQVQASGVLQLSGATVMLG